jgi:diamine N-acetyltransferase
MERVLEMIVNIRYATTDDAGLLSELGARTFFEAFAQQNTPANMAAHLERSFSPEIQYRELSQADTVFLIAESEGQPVGYLQLLINSREKGIEGSRPLEIRRIYVLPEFIGRGAGKELMTAAFNEARKWDCDCIWLGVWDRNNRAIVFYKKWGFHEVGAHIFTLGEDSQRDLIMVKDLA